MMNFYIVPIAILIIWVPLAVFSAEEQVSKLDNCDYYGLDIYTEDEKILRLDGINADQCEESCIRKEKCTHFTWSVHGCFLKNADTKEKATNTFAIYIGAICGMIEDRFPKVYGPFSALLW